VNEVKIFNKGITSASEESCAFILVPFEKQLQGWRSHGSSGRAAAVAGARL
jgi:hypothetical protein